MNTSNIKGNAKEGFLYLQQKYGKSYAQDIERLFRHETNHFTSGQWLKCGTAGLVAFSESFPYGWISLSKFVEKHNLDKKDFYPVYFSTTSDGKSRSYIHFPETKYSVIFTGEFLQEKRNGKWWHWFSLDESKAQHYKNLVLQIKPRFIV